MSAWSTMDTAPRDGTPILAYCQPRHVETGKPMTFAYMAIVYRVDADPHFPHSQWKWRHHQNGSAAEPTHWQPLPDPP